MNLEKFDEFSALPLLSRKETRAILKRSGLSQQQLAERIHVKLCTVKSWVCPGARRVPNETNSLLLRVLDELIVEEKGSK